MVLRSQLSKDDPTKVSVIQNISSQNNSYFNLYQHKKKTSCSDNYIISVLSKYVNTAYLMSVTFLILT